MSQKIVHKNEIFLFYEALKAFSSLWWFHCNWWNRIRDFPFITENMEGLRCGVLSSFLDHWFELLQWVILLSILVEVIELFPDVLCRVKIWTECWQIYHTDNLRSKPHFYATWKGCQCVVFIKSPVLTPLGVHKTVTNAHTDFLLHLWILPVI